MIFLQLVVIILFFTSDTWAMMRNYGCIGSSKSLGQLADVVSAGILGDKEWEYQQKEFQRNRASALYGKQKKITYFSLDKRRKRRHTKHSLS